MTHAQRPDSLETLQLAFELLRRIPKARTVTAPELHQQLADAGYERDMRTVQRLLETLSEVYDIERDDSSKPYRYRWKEFAKGLSLPSLSAQESLLLMLAEQHLSSLLPAKLMKSMEGFFFQARSQLAEKGNREFTEHRRASTMTMEHVRAIAKHFGNTITSTLWRCVEQSEDVTFATIGEHPHHPREGRPPIEYFVRSKSFEGQFPNISDTDVWAWMRTYCRYNLTGPLGATEPAPDRNSALREQIVALAHRHRRYGAGMIYWSKSLVDTSTCQMRGSSATREWVPPPKWASRSRIRTARAPADKATWAAIARPLKVQNPSPAARRA